MDIDDKTNFKTCRKFWFFLDNKVKLCNRGKIYISDKTGDCVVESNGRYFRYNYFSISYLI